MRSLKRVKSDDRSVEIMIRRRLRANKLPPTNTPEHTDREKGEKQTNPLYQFACTDVENYEQNNDVLSTRARRLASEPEREAPPRPPLAPHGHNGRPPRGPAA